MVGNIDVYDGQQNLEEWIRMVERTAAFSGWNDDHTYKAALFRLRGEASEHIEQLCAEKQVSNWEQTKKALKARFQTKGREQLYQHLLNTGTQCNKTVQEWAQVVRNLSLRAMGNDGPVVKAETGRADTGEEGEDQESNKAVLNFMRKTNFIRGLRKNLRQEVWRQKCKTFEEAVEVAAAEEALEMANHEEEVLSCFQGNSEKKETDNLIKGIVAALDAREAAKERRDPEVEDQWTRQGEGARPKETRITQSNNARVQEYRGQLPLPKPGHRDGSNANQFRLGTKPFFHSRFPRFQSREEEAEYWRHMEKRLCFYCHQPGHIQRDCRVMDRDRMPGNDFRRLQQRASRPSRQQVPPGTTKRM